MSSLKQIKVPAFYMRGGTSKGVFFSLEELPENCRIPRKARDAFLQRVIGSPDKYGKQIDGMGGATSSTSKTVIISKSEHYGHDIDYIYGQVAISDDFVDWSGNCGNLTAAVGPFAIAKGLIAKEKIPENGKCTVNIWQANINKTIVAHVPIATGEVQEDGEFELDGVTFPAAEIQLEFMDPAGEGDVFPTRNIIDILDVPETIVSGGKLKATLINSGIPTIFINADDLGLNGTELQDDINNYDATLEAFETLRAIGAIKMGLIKDITEAKTRQHTPKIAFVSPPREYVCSSGKEIKISDIDLCVRALSMGKLHHAMMGTAAVAIGTAVSIDGTIPNLAAGGGKKGIVTFGHPSRVLKVGAEVSFSDGRWDVTKAIMSRSARVLMEGQVRIPHDAIK